MGVEKNALLLLLMLVAVCTALPWVWNGDGAGTSRGHIASNFGRLPIASTHPNQLRLQLRHPFRCQLRLLHPAPFRILSGPGDAKGCSNPPLKDTLTPLSRAL